MAIKVKVGGSRSIRSVPKQDTNRPIIAQGEKKPVIVPDSVVLGIDTIGPYAREIIAGDGISVSSVAGTGGESANVTISHAATLGAESSNNTNLGIISNLTIDQFGHVNELENTELDPNNFSVANNVISSKNITLGNTAITLGESTTILDGLSQVQVGDLTFALNRISSTGDIQLLPPVDGVLDLSNHRIINVRDPIDPYDVVTANYLGDQLEALEFSLLIIDDPTKPTDATNKRYVDNIAQGIAVRPSALAATTEDLSNIGGVWESNSNSAIETKITLPPSLSIDIDGVTNWEVGSQLLVKDQSNPVENGSYELVQVGDPVANLEWIFERGEFNNDDIEIPGSFEFVTDGNVNKNKGFVATVADAETFEIDTHSINWVQFSGVGTFTAGTGLSLNATEFSVNEQQILDQITTPDNVLKIVGNGGLVIPVGTTSERTRQEAGMVRYNTSDQRFEGYNGTAWAGLGGTVDTDQDTYVLAENSPGSDNDELKFFTAGSQRLIINSDGTISANSSITINDSVVIGDGDVSTFRQTGAIEIPKGTAAERPAPQIGMIRYNTEDQRFEGFDNTGYWNAISGSVIDLDRDTQILAESSNGADNDQLDFYTAGVQRLQLHSDGDFKFGDGLNKFTIDFATGNTNIAGTLNVEGVVTIAGNITLGDEITDSISVVADFESDLEPKQDGIYDLGSITRDWRRAYVENITNNNDRLTIETDIVDINASGALIIPVGDSNQRPSPEQGMVRYNTTDSRFEAYNGIAWTGLGGVVDVDQDTYVVAESSPGADNDTLQFYTAGNKRLEIDSNTASFSDKLIIDYNTGDIDVNGKITVDEIIIDSNTITSANGNLLLAPETSNNFIDVANTRIINVGTPIDSTDAVNLQYLENNFSSTLTTISGANTFNGINLTSSPTLRLGDGLEVVSEDSANNEIEIGMTDTGVTAGTYGNDGFTPRVRIDENGRIEFATEIPVELQANAIPDFTETTRDIVSDMFVNGDHDGVTVINDDANNVIGIEVTHDYIRDINPGFGILVNHTPDAGSVANVAVNVGFFDARYINVTGDTMTGDLAAPKFVDADDINYYIDPNSISRINRLIVGYNQSTSRIDMVGSQGVATFFSDGEKIGALNNFFNYVYYGDKNTNNFHVEFGDVISRRFVDVDDTNYFLHPAGSDSHIKQLNIDDRLDITNLTLRDNIISSNTGLIDFATNRLTNLSDPSSNQDAATKSYVDAVAQSLRVIPSALAATTSDLGGVYSAINKTITIPPTAILNIDGVTDWDVGDRILVKDQTVSSQNGSYEITAVGDALTSWVITRGEYFNETSEIPGSFQFVTDGTINGSTGWVATVVDAESFVLDIGDVTWYQFSGAGTYTGGDGLTLNGNDFSVNVDDTGIEIVADQLQLKDDGVTNAKLENPTFNIVDENGVSQQIELGTNLTFEGVDGVDTTVTAGQVAIAVTEIDGGTF